MTFETAYNLFMIAAFGYTMYNLGQCAAISRMIRKDYLRRS